MFSAVLALVYFTSFTLAEISNFSNNEFTDDENRQYVKGEGTSIEDNPNSIDRLPGDYPTYTAIPRTGFSCEGKLIWRYYADPEARCQVYHICETQYSKISFVCPIGSVFNQRHLICDWFYNFDCNDAVGLYPLSNEFNDQGLLDETGKPAGESIAFDLSIAPSGENAGLANETKIANYPEEDERNSVPIYYKRRNQYDNK